MIYWVLDVLRARLESLGLGWLVRVFDQVEFRALLSAGLAFAVVLVLGKPTIRWLVRLKVGDSGLTDGEALRAHAASKANVPTMGGVLICGSIVVSTLLLADVVNAFVVVLGMVVVVWLAGVGGADDYLKLTAKRRGTGRQGLRAWEKLVFQLGLGLLVGVFAYGQAAVADGPSMGHVLKLPWQPVWDAINRDAAEGLVYLPRVGYVVVALLMITGMSNAVNITDGMDGLAAGLVAAVGSGLMVLCLIAGDAGQAIAWMVPKVAEADELGVMAAAMVGACLGFLWWNCNPARVFMGDTGSLALGGLIGFIAVVIRQEIVVLLMCGVFLAEIGSVVIQVAYFRSTGGKRVFRMAPYHHHLHLGGWTESQVVQRLWIVEVVLLIAGLTVVRAGAA